MARNAAQAVLSNPDLVRVVLNLICKKVSSKNRTLARLLRINKAFYASGIPLLYHTIYLDRSSYAVHLRGLRGNSSLGPHVRRLEAKSMTVEQLDDILAHLSALVYMRWGPLATEGVPIVRLPRLSESIESLDFMSYGASDATCRYNVEALKEMVAPLRQLRRMIVQDLNLHELSAILQVRGREITHLWIDRTYNPRISSKEAECWPHIFDSLPAVQSLAVSATCPASSLRHLPASLENLMLLKLDPTAMLDVARRLKDPTWLPRLQSIPSMGSIKWTIRTTERYGYDYLDSLPSKREVNQLAAEAVVAFRQRASRARVSKSDAHNFRQSMLDACEENVAWHWRTAGNGGYDESGSEDESVDSEENLM